METTKRAMVVGVNTYTDTDIPDLGGAHNDASEIKEILTKHGDFEVEDEHFLLNEEATCDAVMNGISDILWSTDPCDLVLIYFSGHGFVDGYGTGYIAPHDMIKQKPLVHGIQMQLLKSLALRSRNKRKVLLMLDCCYSGIAAQGEKNIPSAVELSDACFSDIQNELEADQDGTGIIIFSSSASDQTSRERLDCCHTLGNVEPHPHGEFTFQLLEGLAGGAAYDEHGWISAADLMGFVDIKMKAVPNQTTRFFGADIANLMDIVIARAAQLTELSEKLKCVRTNIDSGSLADLIFAAKNLSDVLDSSPNFEEAARLRDRLNVELEKCKKRMLVWLLNNRLDIMQQARVAFGTLEKSVHTFCYDELTRTTQTTALLTILLQVIDNEIDKAQLLSYLLAFEDEPSPKGPKVPGRGRG